MNDKIPQFCKEHPNIVLVTVKDDTGFITERCAVCDMDKI